jgi:hypothetical protein
VLAPHANLPRRTDAIPPPSFPALWPLAEGPQEGMAVRSAPIAGRECHPQPLVRFVRFVRSWPSISPPGKNTSPLTPRKHKIACKTYRRGRPDKPDKPDRITSCWTSTSKCSL